MKKNMVANNKGSSRVAKILLPAAGIVLGVLQIFLASGVSGEPLHGAWQGFVLAAGTVMAASGAGMVWRSRMAWRAAVLTPLFYVILVFIVDAGPRFYHLILQQIRMEGVEAGILPGFAKVLVVLLSAGMVPLMNPPAQGILFFLLWGLLVAAVGRGGFGRGQKDHGVERIHRAMKRLARRYRRSRHLPPAEFLSAMDEMTRKYYRLRHPDKKEKAS